MGIINCLSILKYTKFFCGNSCSARICLYEEHTFIPKLWTSAQASFRGANPEGLWTIICYINRMMGHSTHVLKWLMQTVKSSKDWFLQHSRMNPCSWPCLQSARLTPVILFCMWQNSASVSPITCRIMVGITLSTASLTKLLYWLWTPAAQCSSTLVNFPSLLNYCFQSFGYFWH